MYNVSLVLLVKLQVLKIFCLYVTFLCFNENSTDTECYLGFLGQEVFDVEDNLKESGRLKVFNIQSGFYQNQFQPGTIIHVFQTWHRAEPGTGQGRGH